MLALILVVGLITYAQELDIETLTAGIRYNDSLVETCAGEMNYVNAVRDPKLPPGFIMEEKFVAFFARQDQNLFVNTLESKTTKGWVEICHGPGRKIVIISREGEEKKYFKHDSCMLATSHWCDPAKWYADPWGYARYRKLPFWKQIEQWGLSVIRKEEISVWDGNTNDTQPDIAWPGQKHKVTGDKLKKKVMCYVIGKGKRSDRDFKHAWVSPEMGFRVLKSECRLNYGGNYCGQIKLIHYKEYKYRGKTILFPDKVRMDAVYLTNENQFDSYKYKVTLDFTKFGVNVDVSKYFDLKNWIPADAMIRDSDSKELIPAKKILE